MGSKKKRKDHKRDHSRSRSPTSKKERSSTRKRKQREETGDDVEIQKTSSSTMESTIGNYSESTSASPSKKSKRSSDDGGASREKRRRKDEKKKTIVDDDEFEEGELDEAGDTNGAGGSSSAGGGGGGDSMSVEETNKLRAKLGLAPLEVDGATSKNIEGSDGQTLQMVKVDGDEFVHKPAENWGSKREADTIREKMHTLREKRKGDEKLGKVKLLGDPDEADSAVSWVSKMRKAEQEKRLAEQRERMLQEMDDQSEMITEERPKKKAVAKKPMAKGGYGSKDLAGMTVQHSKEALLGNNETILVLQDKDVLDESEDILVNPTIQEQEKWKKNADIRKKKPGYNPFEEDLDEYGMPKNKLLSKYDEEIDGEQRESFKLSETGHADIRAERERVEMLARLKEGAESLDSPAYKLANEYLTSEEMEKFKKPKRRVKKIRKRGGDLKADDLLASGSTVDEDFGSRQRGRGRKKAEYESGHMEKLEDEGGDVKMERSDSEDDDDYQTPMDEDIHKIVLSDDEAEQELQAAVTRTRQMQQSEQKKIGVEKVVENMPKIEPEEDEEDEMETTAASAAGPGRIVMDSVSEYCRGLGDIPTYGMAGNRVDVDEDDLIDVEQEKPSTSAKPIVVEEDATEDNMDVDEIGSEADEKEERGGWYERDINDTERARSVSSSSSNESDDVAREPILEEEPDMKNMGVGAALKLAMQKGYLKKEDSDRSGRSHLEYLKAQKYQVVDKQFHDIDDKYAKKLERMGGSGGPIQEFKEKSEYKPNVKLEYADEKGRLLDQKDAFRYLSWKFHGKAPGKLKTEKRTKKLMEKELFNEMSSTDTPLGTLSKQIEKQRQTQAPYIVLSGKDSGTSIKKD